MVDALRIEVVGYPPLEVLADVLLQHVAGSVPLVVAFEESLPGALRDHYDGVVLPGGKAALKGGEEPVVSVYLEVHLGHEAEVHDRSRHRRVRRDEP